MNTIEDIVEKFLNTPDGDTYELLIITLQHSASKQILSMLDEKELHNLLVEAEETFGNLDIFLNWLWSTLQSEGIKPIDLIKNGDISLLYEILGRIRHGSS